MSKLDDILDDLYTVGNKKYELRRKQQIKDLILELIDGEYPEKTITYVEDSRRNALRKKVEVL